MKPQVVNLLSVTWPRSPFRIQYLNCDRDYSQVRFSNTGKLRLEECSLILKYQTGGSSGRPGSGRGRTDLTHQTKTPVLKSISNAIDLTERPGGCQKPGWRDSSSESLGEGEGASGLRV